MTVLSSATPLIALDAVVIDTETTSVDPRDAWIVEIAAVRIFNGRLQDAHVFRRLVRPGDAIPSASTRIHGIDEAAIADAPTFAEICPDLTAFVGDTVVIGHVLGFDLAVLKRECERGGITWKRPRTLDTRLLAEVVEPNLASFTLDSLGAWLGVEVSDRHTARGDAMACARIFLALLPRLRDGGIRTLGEAERACSALTQVLEEHHRAGWIEPVEAPNRLEAERALRRVDAYAYRHRIGDVMRAPAEFIAAGEPVRAAIARMMQARVTSLYIRGTPWPEGAARAAETGIVTERDLLRAVTEQGADVLEAPVARFMSAPLATVPADAFVYRAIGRMDRLRVRHLGVVDEAGAILGAVSTGDLLHLRARNAMSLGDEIDHAHDVGTLAAAWAKVPQVAAALMIERLSGREIAAVIARELGALTRQAAVIAEARMSANGHGGPPCPFALGVVGAAGRGESLLAAEQANALVFATGEPGGDEDRWFELFAFHIAGILNEAAIPFSRSGVMAKAAPWRGSIATWRARIGRWLAASTAPDLRAVDAFFDLRGVHGDGSFTNLIRSEAFAAANGQAAFAGLLAEAAGTGETGLAPSGAIKTDQGRIDLAKTGVAAIETTARALAIRHHILDRSTPGRLAGVKAAEAGGDDDLDALAEAHGVLLDLVLAQQIDDLIEGLPATNAVLVRNLTKRERERLRLALQAAATAEQVTRQLLFER